MLRCSLGLSRSASWNWAIASLTLAFPEEGRPEIAMPAVIIRTQLQILLILANGFIPLALPVKRVGQVVMRIRVIGFQPHCFPVLTDGFIQPALLAEDESQSAVGLPIVFNDDTGVLKKNFAVFPIADLDAGDRNANQDGRRRQDG